MFSLCVVSIVYVLGGAGFLPLLVPPVRRPSLAEAAVAAGLGLSAAGVAWLMGLSRGHGTAMALAMVVVLGPACATFYRRGRRVLPETHEDRWSLAALGLILLLWMAPVAAGAALMARGAYPAAFFNVDSSFRLVHVRELTVAPSLPPRSLSNLDVVPPNHYGGPAIAAFVGKVGRLHPHTALFGVVTPLAALAAFGATLLLARLIAGASSPSLGLAIFVFLLTTWVWPVAAVLRAIEAGAAAASIAPVKVALETLWQDPQSFNNYFEDVTHLCGRFLFILACVPLIAPSRRAQWAGAFCVVLLAQVKTGHALIAGMVLMVACVVDALRSGRVAAMVPGIVGLLAGQLLARLGRVDTMFRLEIEPLWMARHFPDVLERYAYVFLLLAIVPLLPGLARGAAARLAGTWPLVLTVGAIFGFFNVFGAWWPGRSWTPGVPAPAGPFASFIEPLLQMHTLFGIVGAAGLAALWPGLPRARRAAALALIVALTLPALIHRTVGAAHMVTTPELAHEYVDNREIAAALSSVPLKTGVIATNDLRYPANYYARDLLQYQIPAVHGHQAFGLPGWDRYRGWEDRIELQRRLARSEISCETLRELASRDVTHLLLHRRWPHPLSVPLPLLYRSTAYEVYQLEGTVGDCRGAARLPVNR
jgi:hypothetical protein